jgi:hypothetical protein
MFSQIERRNDSNLAPDNVYFILGRLKKHCVRDLNEDMGRTRPGIVRRVFLLFSWLIDV